MEHHEHWKKKLWGSEKGMNDTTIHAHLIKSGSSLCLRISKLALLLGDGKEQVTRLQAVDDVAKTSCLHFSLRFKSESADV